MDYLVAVRKRRDRPVQGWGMVALQGLSPQEPPDHPMADPHLDPHYPHHHPETPYPEDMPVATGHNLQDDPNPLEPLSPRTLTPTDPPKPHLLETQTPMDLPKPHLLGIQTLMDPHKLPPWGHPTPLNLRPHEPLKDLNLTSLDPHQFFT